MPGMALLRGSQGEDREQTGPLGAQVGGDRSRGGGRGGEGARGSALLMAKAQPAHSIAWLKGLLPLSSTLREAWPYKSKP